MSETPEQFDPSMFKTLEEMREAFPEQVENFAESKDGKGFVRKTFIPESTARVEAQLIKGIEHFDADKEKLEGLNLVERTKIVAEALESVIGKGLMTEAMYFAQRVSEELRNDLEQVFHLNRYWEDLGIPELSVYKNYITVLEQDPSRLTNFIAETEGSYDFLGRIPVERTDDLLDRATLLSIKEGKDFSLFYSLGLPISSEMRSVSDNDRMEGDVQFVDRDYCRSLLNLSAEPTDETVNRVASKVMPIWNITNLVYHRSGTSRLPLIAKTGLISRAEAERYTKSRYRGITAMTSGWGRPVAGDNVIDVYDAWYMGKLSPETKATHGIKRMRRMSRAEGEPEQRIVSFDAIGDVNYKYSFSPEQLKGLAKKTYPTANPTELHYDREGVTLIIKLDEERKGKRIRIGGESSIKRSYVLGHVRPNEIKGVIFERGVPVKLIETVYAANKGCKLPKNWRPTLSDKKALEIIGTNTELPIYDGLGNLLWPTKTSNEELVREAGRIGQRNSNPEEWAQKTG